MPNKNTPEKTETPLHPALPVFLIDGSSFLYRAYYALGTLNAPDGTPVQAVFGFSRMIKKVIDQFNPHFMAVVWDSPGKTVRHERYSAYKATRQAAPSDLGLQKELIQEFVTSIGLKQVAQQGIEADDLIATLAQTFSAQSHDVIIISSDKDLGQLAGPKVRIFDPFKDTILDVAALENAYGFSLEKLPFYYALIGDSSDNIPGVRGIGPKTATALVQQFTSLTELYSNLSSIASARTRTLLEANRDNAFLSEELFTLQTPPTTISLEECALAPDAFLRARPFFERLNFTSLLKQLPAAQQSPSPQAHTKYSFSAITTEKELKRVCAAIALKKQVAIDTETTSVKALQTELVGISLCYETGSAYYIPVHKNYQAVETQTSFIASAEESAHTLSHEVIARHLKPLFESEAIKKYMHHAKFDLLVLKSTLDLDITGLAFDTMVAAGLVREEGGRVGLKTLSEQYLHESMITFQEVVTNKKLTNFSQVPLALAVDYAAADAHQTFALVPLIQKELEKAEQLTLYQTIEHPLIHVLYKMELEGIDVDRTILNKLNAQVTATLKVIEAEIRDLVGMSESELNLNSPQQVSDLLFNKLKLTPVKKTSGKTGYSTDSEVLSELALIHPIPQLIIRYRELFKLKSTYIDALPLEINPNTGRIHTTYKQTSVATGRLASVEPNLQNIPTSTPLLNKDLQPDSLSIRAAFMAPQNELLISADYSQIELRVLAYLSQDPTLKTAFLHGEDIHARTAAGLFDIPLDKITSEQRQIAKRINFSILYGLTPFGLAKDLNIPQHDAKLYIEKYKAQYPGVQVWMEQAVEEAKANGFVTTLWGRRRPVPGIYEKNQTLYQLARRIAINTKAQGTAADLMKIGMIELDAQLLKKTPDAKIILQIHDELIITAPENSVDTVAQIVKNTLESVVTWDIPLIVQIRTGKTWADVSK
ncbi:MAG: polymerase I protein [candidate division TM6 bacterium GW2011_GWE2_42_60]|nr:MAG: polymerase I protein [candidate division TM6 bacterium GW2011_GWE2_42_60]